MTIRVQVTEKELSVDETYRSVVREDCGAVCLFSGTVRNQNEGKPVVDVDYTAFAEMAEKELRKIGEEIAAKWKIGDATLVHRTGRLKPAEISVIVAVSAPHRAEAFEACRYAIDALKETVPIWKEEFYEKGKKWL